MSKPAYLITAIGTPLESEERLNDEGLECHLADQWDAGIDGILAAGSMGMMQMLRDETYQSLVKRVVELSQGRGEVLVGVGDVGWARTSDRIEVVSRYAIDGVVVLTPYLFRFSREQLIDYFRSLADLAPVPLYLYDLPGATGVSIDLETYLSLSKHPNIRGAKISGRLEFARVLMQHVGGDLRVIVAEPDKVAPLLREGIHAHLDGMFAIAPHWVVAIARAAAQEDWARADLYQTKLNKLRDLIVESKNGFGTFTAMMNARNIPGDFYAAPYPALCEQDRLALLSAPIMAELVASHVAI